MGIFLGNNLGNLLEMMWLRLQFRLLRVLKEFLWSLCYLTAHRNDLHGLHCMLAQKSILAKRTGCIFSKNPQSICWTVQDTCLQTNGLPDAGLGDVSAAQQQAKKATPIPHPCLYANCVTCNYLSLFMNGLCGSSIMYFNVIYLCISFQKHRIGPAKHRFSISQANLLFCFSSQW